MVSITLNMRYQKSINNNIYDVIIIGSGMAGLTTAANLVAEGLSVLVLEQHFIAGGATTMFKRNNFIFEAGGHRFSGIKDPNGVLTKLFKKINKTINAKTINPSYVVRSGDKILIKDKKAIGVKIKEGLEIRSKAVVSTASNRETYLNLIDKNLSGKKIIHKIEHQKQSGSLFQLFLGLKEEDGEGLEYTTTFVTNNSNIDSTDVYKKIYNWDLDTITSNGVITVEGKENSPEGFRSVNISCLIPYHHSSSWYKNGKSTKTYREFKENIAKKIIENFSKYIPNLKDRIVYQNTATPLTIERYTLATEGGLQGLAHTVGQSGRARGKIRTHIKNLYHAGQYNFPGTGIITVSISGNLCAKIIIKDLYP